MTTEIGTGTFFYHYHRGKDKISVHCKGKCHIVSSFECKVPTRSRRRKDQPRFVVVGSGRLLYNPDEDSITILPRKNSP